jgi:hypothetical protein
MTKAKAKTNAKAKVEPPAKTEGNTWRRKSTKHGIYETRIVHYRLGYYRQHYAIAEVEGKIVKWFAVASNTDYEYYELEWLEPYEIICIDQGVTVYRPTSNEKVLKLEELEKFLYHDHSVKIYDVKRW